MDESYNIHQYVINQRRAVLLYHSKTHLGLDFFLKNKTKISAIFYFIELLLVFFEECD